MKIEFLISTMNREDDRFLKDIFQKESPNMPPYVVVNQCIIDINNDEKNNSKTFFSVKEKGLSKSRNFALSKAKNDILVIADDDIIYEKDVENIILNSFENNPEADIITFQIKKSETELYKDYSTTSYWHNMLSLMRTSSIEIALRRKSIEDKKLKFDENFGLGTEYSTGEEIIFLTDALRKGLKILYLPIPIVIHPDDTSGMNLDDKNLVQAKGALFYRMFKWKAYLILIIFSLKKRKYSRFGLLGFLRNMIIGLKKYKSQFND